MDETSAQGSLNFVDNINFPIGFPDFLTCFPEQWKRMLSISALVLLWGQSSAIMQQHTEEMLIKKGFI